MNEARLLMSVTVVVSKHFEHSRLRKFQSFTDTCETYDEDNVQKVLTQLGIYCYNY